VEVAAFAIVLLLALAMPAYGLMPVRPRQKFKPGTCWKCGYSRDGLGEADCPECGSSGVPYQPPMTDVPSRRQHVTMWSVYCSLAIAVTLGRHTLLRAAYGLMYMRDGFTFEQGWRLSPERELYTPSGQSTLVFGILMLALPLLARLGNVRKSVMIAIFWIALAFVIASIVRA
jgi:hypothetical protein